MPGRKPLLLRVGIDRGIGGALASVFADRETEPTRCSLTFASLPAGGGNQPASRNEGGL